MYVLYIHIRDHNSPCGSSSGHKQNPYLVYHHHTISITFFLFFFFPFLFFFFFFLFFLVLTFPGFYAPTKYIIPTRFFVSILRAPSPSETRQTEPPSPKGGHFQELPELCTTRIYTLPAVPVIFPSRPSPCMYVCVCVNTYVHAFYLLPRLKYNV